ncbi:DUF3575 domain-containing protein [Luteirhabdus pelagi]|uniref:DUF3575 domain-containing protein n=1 Tax=Luteirhabdus pelagi TaxID=2792783 RepID=UPI001939B329|nr:DUF3575 domain-containing protein [Luteirhabdus pelagi]
MKQLFLAFSILGSLFCQAQDAETAPDASNRKHEVRIDATEAIAIPNIEINYEYIISRYSGFGAAISVGFSDDYYHNQKFAFTPYYRQYFLNKKEYGARGLFAEGLLQATVGNTYNDDFYYTIEGEYIEESDTNDWFNFGIGFAVGQKWVSNNGFVFEISLGGGRYLINDDDAPEAFFRGGILVGYRIF